MAGMSSHIEALENPEVTVLIETPATTQPKIITIAPAKYGIFPGLKIQSPKAPISEPKTICPEGLNPENGMNTEMNRPAKKSQTP